jgi:hypothetical protein
VRFGPLWALDGVNLELSAYLEYVITGSVLMAAVTVHAVTDRGAVTT